MAKSSHAHVGPTTLSAKTQYLVLYNLISFLLWVSVLLRLVIALAVSGGSGLVLFFGREHDAKSSVKTTATNALANVYPSTSHVVTWTQTLALLEILHATFGLVRTSIVTTSMQVASRLFLIWGIIAPFGDDLLEVGVANRFANATGIVGLLQRWGIGSPLRFEEPVHWNQAAYSSMLIAWTVTECIRYLYFVFFLSNDAGNEGVPKPLRWLRYNTFFLLYPIGITGECWLIYHAIPFARKLDGRYAWIMWAVLAIYVPGSYILYSHMIAQRRRIARGKGKQKAHAE